MTAATLTLIVVLLGVLLLCVKPLGIYIANVMEGKPIWALRIGAPVERFFYRASGVDAATEMGWKRYALALLLFNALGGLAAVSAAAAAGVAAAQSAAFRERLVGLLVQYCRQLHHQHELAGLFRRIDDELSHADGGARRTELPVGGHRHCRRHRAHPWTRATQLEIDRQLLGRPHALHSLYLAAAFRRCWHSFSPRRESSRISTPTRTSRRSRPRRRRRCRWVRSPRRNRSRNSAPMAADS